MKLRQLEVLNAVLQTGSVTHAAKLLNVSQPSVSTVLQHCEAQLGVQLFIRSGGRLRPTPEVEQLYPEIRAVFDNVDRVTRRAQSLATGTAGRITVAGTLALATGMLVDAVAAFRLSHPAVTVTVHAFQTPELVKRVAGRELDIGMCYGPVDHDALEVERISAAGMVCVLLEDHPLAAKDVINIQDVADERLITYDATDRLRGKVDRLLAALPRPPVLGIEVGQTITAIRLVQAGAGIALVEPFYFAAMQPAGLVARPLLPRQELVVEALTAYGIVRSRVSAAFMNCLRAQAALAQP